jgi:hypothetical protein
MMFRVLMRALVLGTSLVVAMCVGLPVAPSYAQCPSSCGGTAQNVSWNGWTFSFLRPCLTRATTAGGRGGGIEVRNARFNGREVFFKAHTPILTVKYQNDACGPFRDWQYEESPFQCSPAVAPGRCNGPAVTNCANPAGGDVGTFCGVSVDTSDPDQLVLTTMVRAGWYRYQLEWYFFRDGTFRPAIRWTGVPHPCLNNTHIHFVYWRIDFDIDGGSPNTIEEFNGNSPLVPGYWPSWDPLFVEMDRMKERSGTRIWRVRNDATGRAYRISPPEALSDEVDGVAVAPQIADIWALAYNSALQEETDDCAGTPKLCTLGGGAGYWPHLSRFITQTSSPNLLGKDVVFWYGAAHLHESGETSVPCHAINGPYCTPE